METTDLTPIILKNIQADVVDLRAELRTQVRQMDARLDKIETRLGGVEASNTSLERRFDRLEQRVVESDIRAISAHAELRPLMDRLIEFLDDQGKLERRVEGCEAEISDIRSRLP